MLRLTVSGYTLQVEVTGSPERPAVLLLHGFPDSHALWTHQAAALSGAGWRVVAPDLLGYGGSDKPVDTQLYALGRQAAMMEELMVRRLGHEQFAVVGHDFGAALAWRLATQAPSRVLKLAVVSVGSPAVFFAAGGAEQRRRAWYQLFFLHQPAAEQGLAAHGWALLREMMRGEPEGAVEEYVAALSKPGALSAALAWYRANTPPAMFAQTRAASLPLVRCPTLGVWSSGDAALTEAQMVASQRQVAPGLWRYERLEGCGHWVPRGAPGRLSALLLDFLGACPAGPASRL